MFLSLKDLRSLLFVVPRLKTVASHLGGRVSLVSDSLPWLEPRASQGFENEMI